MKHILDTETTITREQIEALIPLLLAAQC